ncbi:MAG TPA: DUF4143 domain-containing protein [Prolixibacteraceae bacterium]
MIERSYLQTVMSRICEERKFIQVIVGPRQVGKTTMVGQLLSKIDIPYLSESADAIIVSNSTWLSQIWESACSRALASLKTFYEEAPQYHLVAAGSLLGVTINRDQFSFPVGKVDELFMFPMDFEEFLWATDKELLSREISSHFANLKAMPEALHIQAMELYKQYLIVGGMPAVVAEFVETKSLLTSTEIQGRILNEYIADMAKYASPATSVKIRACYNSIPTQLAKENRKFQYKIVQKGATTTLFGESIEWLNSAGIVLKCQKIDHGFMPISAYSDLSDFRLYMSDIGMLTMKSGMAQQTILSPLEEENGFLGVMSENYVAQALVCNGFPLFYWKNVNTAELDFVLQIEGQVIPVEVKKGLRTKSVSMTMFVKKYNSPYAIRISGKNFGYENQIKAISLYAVFCIN